MQDILKQIWADTRLRYLITGGINTIFGYMIGLILYYNLYKHVHILIIGTISAIIAITFSFTTYKVFVFKSKGKWIEEYLRSYIVYGFSYIINIILTWALVDFIKIPFWIVQLFMIIVIFFISYFGHKKYTFKNK